MKSTLRKRKVGFVVLVFGFLLLIIGIGIYLGGPSMKGLKDLVVPDQKTVKIDAGKFWEMPFDMNRTKSPLVISYALKLRIQVEGGVINVYIMNSSFHGVWRANGSHGGGQEYTRVRQLDIHFIPAYNDTFYLVLDNTRYSTRKNVTVAYEQIATIEVYDFSRPFTGLKVAAFGFLLILAATPLGNPLNHILQAFIVRYRLLLGAGSIESFETTIYAARFSAHLIWFGLAALISMWLCGLWWGFMGFSQLSFLHFGRVPEVLSMAYDLWMRFMLFFLPIFLLPIALGPVVGLIGDAVTIQLRRRLKLTRKSELDLLELKYFWRSWLYPDSVLALAVGAGSTLLAFAQLPPVQSVLLLLAVLVFSLACGRNAYLSFDKACKQLNLNLVGEFRGERILSSVQLTSSIWQTVLFLFVWRWAYSVSLNPIAKFLIKVNYLTKIPMYSLFRNTIDGVLSFLSIINSDYLVFLLSLFAFMGIFYIYLMPNLYIVKLRRKIVRRVVSAGIVFVVSFAFQLLLSLLMPQYVSINISLFGITSMLVAIVTWFMGRTYDEILSKG